MPWLALFVRWPAAERGLEVTADALATVHDLKRLVEQAGGPPPNAQLLNFGFTQLRADGALLADYSLDMQSFGTKGSGNDRAKVIVKCATDGEKGTGNRESWTGGDEKGKGATLYSRSRYRGHEERVGVGCRCAWDGCIASARVDEGARLLLYQKANGQGLWKAVIGSMPSLHVTPLSLEVLWPMSHPHRPPEYIEKFDRIKYDGKGLFVRPVLAKGVMKIFVKSLTGCKIELEVEADTTVAAVKAKVMLKESIPPFHQHLRFNRVGLEDERTLQQYNIQHRSVLDLDLRMRGW